MNVVGVSRLPVDVLAPLLVHWLSLWLGLYLVSRRPRSRATVLAAAAIISMSTYLLCTALLFGATSRAEAVFWVKALGGWSYFAPILWLHAMVCLTETRLPYPRTMLALGYVTSAALMALGFSNTLLYDYWGSTGASLSGTMPYHVGPLYALDILQLAVLLGAAVGVLARKRLSRSTLGGPVRGQLDLLIGGTVLLLLGSCVLMANAYLAAPLSEYALQPILLVGAAMAAMPVSGYSGLVEGQLLRKDLNASLLGTVVVLAGFLILALVSGATHYVIAAAGWFVIACFVLSDQLRSVADLPFFGAAARADREGLLTAARFAGSRRLDVAELSPGQSFEAIQYMSEIERAALASTRLEGARDPRLDLLERDEFAAVRGALGLRHDWTAAVDLSAQAVRQHVAAQLEPRERQALGLKYLGYSDKDMARLMGVKPNVPRSYLGEGKRKLGLAAGAPLMLFVHFSGLVVSDALPLLETRDDLGARAAESAGAPTPLADGEGPP